MKDQIRAVEKRRAPVTEARSSYRFLIGPIGSGQMVTIDSIRDVETVCLSVEGFLEAKTRVHRVFKDWGISIGCTGRDDLHVRFDVEADQSATSGTVTAVATRWGILRQAPVNIYFEPWKTYVDLKAPDPWELRQKMTAASEVFAQELVAKMRLQP